MLTQEQRTAIMRRVAAATTELLNNGHYPGVAFAVPETGEIWTISRETGD